MAGTFNARKVETLTKPGRYADKLNNLYLRITPDGGKRWTFFYRWQGKRKDMGLGSAGKGEVSLALARDKAADAFKLLSSGVDPHTVMGKKARDRAETPIPAFGDFANDYLASHEGKWRNDKHRAQWRMTLETYAAPLRALPVNAIGTDDVLAVLQPLWSTIPETAARLRGRIEAVLDAAKAKGHRTAENPARWRGHLQTLLPARQRLTRGHHAALAYDDLPAFLAALRSRQALAARALEFLIFTAARSGEVLGAKWTEIDMDKALWVVPRARMKAGQEHRIPLSAAALAILKPLSDARTGEHVFPGNRPGKPLSAMSMAMQLRRMKRGDITPHGFRSAFRDWAAEQTSFPHTTAEHALAHRISDKAESAYRRGDELERRRQLMEAWAQWCAPRESSNVVALVKAAS